MAQQGRTCQLWFHVTLCISVGPAFNIGGGFGLSLFWVSLECSEGGTSGGCRVGSVIMSFL